MAGYSLVTWDAVPVSLYPGVSDKATTFKLALIEAVSKNIDLTKLDAINHGNDICGINDDNLLILNGGRFRQSDWSSTFLKYCSLKNSTFQDAAYLPTRFENCDLLNSNFINVRFESILNRSNPIFKNCNLKSSKFDDIDIFTYLFFENCDLSNVFFNNINLIVNSTTGAKPQLRFKDCDLTNSVFEGINFPLFEISFENCNLTNSNFSKSIISKDLFNGCNLMGVDFTSTDFNSQPINNNNNLNGCNFTFSDLTSVSIENNLSANNCNFSQAILKNVNFSYSKMCNAFLEDCFFQGNNCNLLSTNLSGSSLKNALLQDIKYMDFADFSNADLTNVTLSGQSIATIIVTGANFTGVDLSDSMNVMFRSTTNVLIESLEYQLAIATENYNRDNEILNDIYAEINPIVESIKGTAQINYELALEAERVVQDQYDPIETEYYRLQTITDTAKAVSVLYYQLYIKAPSGRNGSIKQQYWIAYQNAEVQAYIAGQQSNAYYWGTLDPKRTELTTAKGVTQARYADLQAVNKKTKPYTDRYDAQKTIVDAELVIVNDLTVKLEEANNNPQDTTYIADLRNVNLTDADLTNADLSYVNMTGVILSNTILIGANFNYCILPDTNLADISFKGCSFIGAFLSGCTFENFNDKSLNFSYADLTGVTFSSGSLQTNDFSYSKMTGAMLVDNIIISGSDGPIFNDALMNDTDLSNLDFFQNQNLKRVNLSGSNLTGSKFDQTDLRNSNLSQAIFNNVSATNSILSGCDMTRIDLSQSVLTNAIFTSADMRKAFLQNANAVSCDFQYCILSGCDMRESDFSHSKFNYANMIASDLRDAKWHSNDFSYADMSQVKAYKLNFYYPILIGTKLSFLETQKINLLRSS